MSFHVIKYSTGTVVHENFVVGVILFALSMQC